MGSPYVRRARRHLGHGAGRHAPHRHRRHRRLHAAPCYPCGACRQALAEFGCRTVVVEVDGAAKALPFVELLPHGFGPADLQ